MIIPKITRKTILYRKLQAEKDQDESGKKKRQEEQSPRIHFYQQKKKKTTKTPYLKIHTHSIN